MRISDLSRKTGVPVATIKFYLRERLLPPGTPTGRNQAVYGETHLKRLLLIRALTNIGQLDLSTVRELLTGSEDERLPLGDLYGLVHSAQAPNEDWAPAENDRMREARADVDHLVEKLGWQVEPDAAGRVRLVQVLASLRRLGCGCDVDFFAPYAEAAERLAAAELDLLPADPVASDRAAAVLRTVLFEVALVAIHRMAQEHRVTLRFKRD